MQRLTLVLSLEFVNEVVDETVVEVLTAKMGVAVGRLNFEDTLLDRQERNIESTTAEIENQDVALTSDLLVKAVGDGGRCGLVDDTQDVKTRDNTSILRSLALRVVEVGGDSDDGVVDGKAEI